MSDDLRDLERAALDAQKAELFPQAIELWTRLTAINATWESGYPFYFLADCYTRTGQLDLAERAYKAAIKIAPEDNLFLVALESLVEARRLGHL